MMFDIIVDKQLDAKNHFDIISGIIRKLHPSLQCFHSETIFNGNRKVDLADNYTWFDIVKTPDEKTWTSSIDFYYFPDQVSLPDFPQIKLCEQISKTLYCNCLCSNMGQIVSGINEQDPYWTLAYMNQEWYFADTGNMELMGPYTDGINETIIDAKLKLLHKLDLTQPKVNLYDFSVLRKAAG